MVNYKELNNNIVDLLNNLILSHQLSFSDIMSDIADNSVLSSDSIETKKYVSIKKNKNIKVTYKNYEKLLVNNGILINEILKTI